MNLLYQVLMDVQHIVKVKKLYYPMLGVVKLQWDVVVYEEESESCWMVVEGLKERMEKVNQI